MFNLSNRIKKFTNLILTLSVFYTQLFAESSYGLFKSNERVIVDANYEEFEYNKILGKYQIKGNPSSLITSSSDNFGLIKDNSQNKLYSFISDDSVQKAVVTYELQSASKDGDNYIESNFKGEGFGENRKKTMIERSFSNKKKIGNVKVFESKFKEEKSMVFSYVTTNGQIGKTYLAKFQDNKDNIKVEVEKVNYLNFYTNLLLEYCRNPGKNTQTPDFLYSPGNLIGLTSLIEKGTFDPATVANHDDLAKMSGVIDLAKANGETNFCEVGTTSENIKNGLLKTNLFNEYDGSLRATSKDFNTNTLISSSITADVMYHNNATMGYLAADYKSVVKSKKSCCKRCCHSCVKDKYWQNFFTYSRLYTIFPLTVISDDNSLVFGSFSMADYNKNGVKISNLFSTPDSSGLKITNQGHKLNYMLVGESNNISSGNFDSSPVISIDGTYHKKSNVICKWATWVIVVVIVLTIIVASVYAPQLTASMYGSMTGLWSAGSYFAAAGFATGLFVESAIFGSIVSWIIDNWERPDFSLGVVSQNSQKNSNPIIRPFLYELVRAKVGFQNSLYINNEFSFKNNVSNPSSVAYVLNNSNGSLELGDVKNQSLPGLYMKENSDFWNSSHWTSAFIDHNAGTNYKIVDNLSNMVDFYLNFLDNPSTMNLEININSVANSINDNSSGVYGSE